MTSARCWQAVLLPALAGGLGWGIRGQYGHETGAMIAGWLVSLTIAFLFARDLEVLATARAVAWGTIAMGFGGSMTYGQTIGLTQDPALIGDWNALAWGMLGLAVKGGIWIGFAGAFLGMGLGGQRYRARGLLILMFSLLALYMIGLRLLNLPFDPAQRVLPAIYFSDDWRWEPASDLEPRFECWGGLLFALAGVVAYVGFIRRDRMARNLALWGMLGGALGFPLGQSLQAYHAWNPEAFEQGIWATLDPHVNWWNMMETTFGVVMGAALGFGAWLNRRAIRKPSVGEEITLAPPVEWLLLAVHASFLVAVEFGSVPLVDALYDLGLVLGLIPVVAVAGGRWWPWLLPLPITVLPIAGKTVNQLVYRDAAIAPVAGWLLYLVLPLMLTSLCVVRFERKARQGWPGRDFARRALLLCVWLYFGLNFALFRFPWPWATWTTRTPNAILFTIAAVGLTIAGLTIGRGETRPGLAPDEKEAPDCG